MEQRSAPPVALRSRVFRVTANGFYSANLLCINKYSFAPFDADLV
jgi:hypothetical protein